MKKLKGSMIATLGPLPVEMQPGEEAVSDMSLRGVDLSALYRVKERRFNGKYITDVIALSFSTRDDYKKFIAGEMTEGIDGPDVYIAEEDELSFLYSTNLPGGLEVTSFLPSNVNMAGENERLECGAIILKTEAQNDGSYRIFLEPYNEDVKRHLLLKARSYPWLAVAGK